MAVVIAVDVVEVEVVVMFFVMVLVCMVSLVYFVDVSKRELMFADVAHISYFFFTLPCCLLVLLLAALLHCGLPM